MGPEGLDLTRVLRRIYWLMFAIAAAGVVIGFAWRGLPVAAGYAVGALASLVSFRVFHRIAERLGSTEEGQAPRKRLAIAIGLRYLIFGAVAYVIVKYFEVSVIAVLVGLLVSAAAVILEILYELIHYGTAS